VWRDWGRTTKTSGFPVPRACFKYRTSWAITTAPTNQAGFLELYEKYEVEPWGRHIVHPYPLQHSIRFLLKITQRKK
jgi:hypothetical protein